MNGKEKTEPDLRLALRPTSGPLMEYDPLMRGSIKVHGNLVTQAFLAPVYKKGKFHCLLYILIEDVDGVLESCLKNCRFQEAQSRILAFRIAALDKSMVCNAY
jgi:hypothetical protein